MKDESNEKSYPAAKLPPPEAASLLMSWSEGLGSLEVRISIGFRIISELLTATATALVLAVAAAAAPPDEATASGIIEATANGPNAGPKTTATLEGSFAHHENKAE